DLNFKPDSSAAKSAGFIERGGSYSWAYLFRRPRNGVTSVVDMTIVVYQQRPLSLTNALRGSENAFQGQVTGPNTVVLNWASAGAQAQTPPAIRVGSWILDDTPVQVTPPPIRRYRPGHAAFYRVVGVTEVAPAAAAQSQLEVEVQ